MDKLNSLKALLLQELSSSKLELLALKDLDTSDKETLKRTLSDVYNSLLAREDSLEDTLRAIEDLLDELEK